MQCENCHREIDEDVNYCPYCGSKVGSRECPKCHNSVSEQDKFCSRCGQPLDDYSTETTFRNDYYEINKCINKREKISSWGM